MWFELFHLAIVGSLCGIIAYKDMIIDHNRDVLKGIKSLLISESAYSQPKIQEYVKKCLDTAL